MKDWNRTTWSCILFGGLMIGMASFSFFALYLIANAIADMILLVSASLQYAIAVWQ